MSTYDYLFRGVPFDERLYLQGSKDIPEKFARGGVASRDDDYIFNRHGEFKGIVESNPGQPHRLVIENDDGSRKYYVFADQVNDPKNVNEWGSKAIPVSRKEIIHQMVKRGALSDFNRGRGDRELWFAWNSLDNEKFDYTKGYLIPTYQEYLRDPSNDTYMYDWSLERKGYIPVHDKAGRADNVFFLPEGDGYAHNTMNFGNFLWGASGRALGITKNQLKAGANIHNKYYLFSGDFGNDDSPDDQLSIERGTKFTEKNNLMNLTWDRKNKKFVPSKPIINKYEYPKYLQPKY